ncbi:MAG TPA: GNAT family N-acetyltransferase [Curvibacter sp.]|nr:GNAT family N-acetyltransferase [Curvibacter sp.]|tara:strand:+ start:147 stop:602 length:456 start_codon:yes stop_codon:yes gene_type:complete
MTTLSIRLAGISDLEPLLLLFDAYRRFYGREGAIDSARTFLRQRLERGESVVLLALLGQQPVGFAQLYPGFSSLSMGRTFVLNDLFVHPEYRKLGAGKGLVEAATEHARRAGAISLSLSTATTNTAAQSLYEALGWQRDRNFFTYEFDLAT